jgi:hypothetical protein
MRCPLVPRAINPPSTCSARPAANLMTLPGAKVAVAPPKMATLELTRYYADSKQSKM